MSVIPDLPLFFRKLPIGETLREILRKKMENIHKIQELKGIHKAVTGSILDLLVDGSVEVADKYKARFGLRDFFQVT